MSNDFFPSRPESYPAIYAYEDTHPQYADLIKVGYTTVGAQSRFLLYRQKRGSVTKIEFQAQVGSEMQFRNKPQTTLRTG